MGPAGDELNRAGAALFDFAIEREELAWLLDRWPAEAQADRSRVEYELQLLKAIAVGWSLAYHLEGKACREPLAATYWQAVNAFAARLSTTAGMLLGPLGGGDAASPEAGRPFDYFQVLKDRLAHYLAAAKGAAAGSSPEALIGPAFARVCLRPQDPFAILAGSKMFAMVSARVGGILKASGL
jgi:hypothetical protein